MSARRHGRIVAGGILLGAGLGGFVDGILFHQILQWHNMLSSVRPPVDLVAMKYNMLWDGLFHAATWGITVAGLAVLWRARTASLAPGATRALVASMVLGWGLFNAAEGTTDHQLLGIHHVHPGVNQLPWDIGFIAAGVLMMVASLAALRRA